MTFLILYCKEQSTREVLKKESLRFLNHISAEQDWPPSWQIFEQERWDIWVGITIGEELPFA